MIREVRAFFEEADFLEVETPLLVPSPGLDVHLDAFAVSLGNAASSSGTAPPPSPQALGYLVTSPEYQMKRLLAEGYPRIVQIARCFRRDESGGLHNPEFTMLEWYRAHAGMADVMADTEALVARVTGGGIVLGGRTLAARPPFPRMTVAEAFGRFAKVSEDEMLAWARSDEDRFFRVWVETVDPALARLPEPTFVVEYPAEFASLARRKPGDPRYAERFELYVAGVELCNGFGELVDAAEQRARLEADQETRRARGLPVYPIDERFLAALEAGMPESGGNALGLDRLVALAEGLATIEPTLSFTAREL